MQTNEVLEVRVNHLETENKELSAAVNAIREKLSNLTATVSALGVTNTLLLGWIAYKLSHG